MGSFLAYTLYSGVFLLLLYLVYKLFISKEKQIALNRVILLGCYVVSFSALPLSRIDWSHTESQLPVNPTIVAIGELPLKVVGIVEEEDIYTIPQIILWIYLMGAFIVLFKSIFSTARLFFYIRKGTFIRKEGYTLVVMSGGDTSPFSFGGYIVMNAIDYEAVCNAVTAHEHAHIRCHHSLDLIAAQAVCVVLWYNPAAWLMRDELKLVHEYQADAAVIDSGVDPKEYQMLLIRKTVGNHFHTLANSLNHSKLKNRIAMMQKEKSSGRSRLRLLSLALALGAALAVVQFPVFASGLKSLETASLEINDATAVDESVNAVEFPGGKDELMKYLAMNIRYPQSAQAENRQGRSVVGFTVAADGSLSDIRILESAGTDLDNESLRVVRMMPNRTLSVISEKIVASEFALPIRFRLKDTEDEGVKKVLSAPGENVNWLDEVQVVAYGTMKKSASMPLEKAAETRHKTVPVEADSSSFTSSETKSVKLYPAVAVSPGTSPKAPLYVDGVLTDKEKIKGLTQLDIESVNVYRPSVLYPEGRVDIELKSPHPYLDLRGTKTRLIIGPCGEKDCEHSAYQVVRVDGELLKYSRSIDVDDIESFNEVAPCEEYPNGLLDIKLKKSASQTNKQ